MCATRRVYRTGEACVRVTKTEALIIELVAAHEGRPMSKAQMAALLGRNEKTVSRLLSHLRRVGLLSADEAHAASGAQLANCYRLTPAARRGGVP